MVITNHKKIVYLPLVEYRLISALYEIAGDGIHYCLYKKYFDDIKSKFHDNPYLSIWHRNTVNAYYDLAISNWCKLFGSYSESTHYHKLLSTPTLEIKLQEININPPGKETLKSILLANANLSTEIFDQYHSTTKAYRDKNLIHREHSPSKVNDGDLSYPSLDIAKETLLSLALILIKLLNQFSANQNEVNCYMFTYDDLEKKDQIVKLIKKSLPTFIESLANEFKK